MKPDHRFDAESHSYYIDGRRVDSVTQVLTARLGDKMWFASEWYLERGRVVHACCALVANGKRFVCDDRVAGQVSACRKFYADLKPEVLEVEKPGYSTTYNFAGCPDLICRIRARTCIVDFKASLTDLVFIQLGGYAVLNPTAKYGMGVELKEDGKYKCTEMVKLDRYRNEFLALLSTCMIRRRLGLEKESEINA